MPAIPLGLKAYRRQANFQPEVQLVNLMVEVDDSGASPDKILRLMRPGYTLRDGLGYGVTRGIFRQANFLGGDLFRVVGPLFYRGTSQIGAIGGADIVAWAAGIDRLFVLADHVLYQTDGLTVAPVAVPIDFAGPPVDIDALNGYVFITCSDGTIYWIVPGEITVDPLNFVTAESSPDGLLAGRRLESEIFFFGQSSIEPWQLTGDADAPIQKAIGRQYERGLKSRDTVRRFDNSLIWVGENNIVYRAAAQPEVICDEGISERIRKTNGLLSALTFSVDRHEQYVLRIPGQGSFAYDASAPQGTKWSRYKSDGMDEWAPHIAISDGDGTIFGAALGPQLWDMAPDSAYEEDSPIEWVVTGNVAMLGRPQRNDSIAIGVGCDRDCIVRLRWHDAREDFPDYYEELDARAPADMVTMYRMGSISPPFRSFELSGNDGARIRISGAATEAWQ